jgi:sugar-phosphatase
VLDEARNLELGEAADPSGTELAPGVLELLSALPRSSWAIVTSSSREGLTSKLSLVGLPMPECLVTANEVRIGKPDPEGYLTAAELLDQSPSDCIVVEDSPAGVEAAHRAGMRCIGVLSTHEASELTKATFLVKQLSDMQVKHIVGGEIALVLSS